MLCQKHDRLYLYYTGCQRKKHEMFSHLQYLEPAMAYVPCQKFTENFPLQYALNAGTIFPQLCKPFCGKRGIRRWKQIAPKTVIKPYRSGQFRSQWYDSVPWHTSLWWKGSDLLSRTCAGTKKLLKEYAEAYGPLIIDITDQTGESIWKWMEQPFPWEKEGACR